MPSDVHETSLTAMIVVIGALEFALLAIGCAIGWWLRGFKRSEQHAAPKPEPEPEPEPDPLPPPAELPSAEPNYVNRWKDALPPSIAASYWGDDVPTHRRGGSL
jgi:hypothetical protein